jgi:HSP20 family molecular chaperone IbpA
MGDSRRITQSGFDDMWRHMEKLMESMAYPKRPPVLFTRSVWQPNVDIYETGEHVVVLAELAGVRADEVTISA